MNCNRVICRNEVIIEGVNVGQFETLRVSGNDRQLGDSAVITIPLYAIGVTNSGYAKPRLRYEFAPNLVKTLAEITVNCWYEGYDKLTVFHGFIEQIVEGFPMTIYARDMTFALKFGRIQKTWGDVTMSQIANDIIPIANEAFKKERENAGFSKNVVELKYVTEGTYVQAETGTFPFNNPVDCSPYDTVQGIMQQMYLYGGVTDNGELYVGALTKDSTRPAERLDTRYNVFDTNLIREDSRFINYEVRVAGTLKNGKRYTAIGGMRNSRSVKQKSALDKKYAETICSYSPLKTVEGLQAAADRQLLSMQGLRNKGRIVIPLYPKIEPLQSVQLNHTLFADLSGNYYVLEYELSCNDSGYFQTLTVTDKVFAI